MLFGMESNYGHCLAYMVPGKGNAAVWIGQRIAKWLYGFGSKQVSLKADGEPAIQALKEEVRNLRGQDAITLLDNPEAGEKQSNYAGEGSGTR